MKTDVRGGEGCLHSDSTPTLPTTLQPDQTRQSPSVSGSGKSRCCVCSRICACDHEDLDIVPATIEQEGPGDQVLHGLYHTEGN